MVTVSAWWGMGYASLMVATIVHGWPGAGRGRLMSRAGDVLIALSALLLWAGALSQGLVEHGWPFVSPADKASASGLLLLPLYLIWWRVARRTEPGLAVAAVALLLLSYGLGQYAWSPLSEPILSPGVLLENVLNALGGSLLALAAASAATVWLCRQGSKSPVAVQDMPVQDGADGSDKLVWGALICLAFALAIDTWWLQKVGLGAINDAQQAGIAISWMVYFVALRLRRSPLWRGWPWTAILVAGFVCTLPILIQVSWLGATLPL